MRAWQEAQIFCSAWILRISRRGRYFLAPFAEASSGGTLAQFLEQIALVADQDTIRDGEGAVRLMQ